MTTHPTPPHRASAKPASSPVESAIVAAYLRARTEEAADDEEGPDYGIECRLKQYARRGGEEYVMSWGIDTQEHAALVALLTAEALENLVDGHKIGGGRGEPERIELLPDVIAEVARIREAMANIWAFFHRSGVTHLLPLAAEMRLLPNGFGPLGEEC